MKNNEVPTLDQPRLVSHWRCFHCDEVFEEREAAQEHFGWTDYSKPLCQISRAEVEQMEFELQRYREEDGPKDRQMAEMESKHAQALREAEEEGYFKGLQDGKHLNAKARDLARL